MSYFPEEESRVDGGERHSKRGAAEGTPSSTSSSSPSSPRPHHDAPTDLIGAQTSALDYFINQNGGGKRIGIAMTVAAWAAGYFGLSWVVAVSISLFAYAFWFQQSRRMRRALRWNLHSVMRDPMMARAIMGMDLPSWINLSPVEQSAWLQGLIDNIWPYMCGPTESSLAHSLTPLLERYRPKALLSSLGLGYFDLGDIPPKIEGIQVVNTNANSGVGGGGGSGDTVAMDMHLVWHGNPDIRIVATMGSAEVEAALSNLQLRALVRLTFGPRCSDWPCFAAMSLSFVGKPQINYTLRAAKVPLDAIPGLAGWLDGFIVMMAGMLVYPRRLVFPMTKEGKHQQKDLLVEPIGCLFVEIKRAMDLPTNTRHMLIFVRAMSTMGDDRRSFSYRTQAIKGPSPNFEVSASQPHASSSFDKKDSKKKQKSNPMREVAKFFSKQASSMRRDKDKDGGEGDEDEVEEAMTRAAAASSFTSLMQFPVYNVPGEQLTFEVMGQRSGGGGLQGNALVNRLLLVQETVLIGQVAMGIGSLLEEQYEGCARLTRSSDKHMSKSHSSSAARKVSEDIGSLAFATMYRPYADLGSDGPGGMGGGVLERNLEDIGLVIVEVVKAQHLPAADLNGLSDPYVVVRVGSHEARTPTVFNSIDPTFNTILNLNVDARELVPAGGGGGGGRKGSVSAEGHSASFNRSSGVGASLLRNNSQGGASSRPPSIEVLVFDEDSIGTHELLGKAYIPFDTLLRQTSCTLPIADYALEGGASAALLRRGAKKAHGGSEQDEAGSPSPLRKTRRVPSITLGVKLKLFAV